VTRWSELLCFITYCTRLETFSKDMNEHLIADLGRLVDGQVVTLSESPGHVSVRIVHRRSLQSHVGKEWVQAVPLAQATEQRAAGNVRHTYG
jgi:hypothetical protein